MGCGNWASWGCDRGLRLNSRVSDELNHLEYLSLQGSGVVAINSGGLRDPQLSSHQFLHHYTRNLAFDILPIPPDLSPYDIYYTSQIWQPNFFTNLRLTQFSCVKHANTLFDQKRSSGTSSQLIIELGSRKRDKLLKLFKPPRARKHTTNGSHQPLVNDPIPNLPVYSDGILC